MLLKKKCLEKFIDKIESRGYSYDRKYNYADIPIDDSSSMRAVVTNDSDTSPCFSVHCEGPSITNEDAERGKAHNECNRIVGEILKELEDEGC